MKKILITGANSYIGESFETYMKEYQEFEIDTLDMLSPTWKDYDFSSYDVVFHVAGIAHSDNGKISEEKAKLYYSINTDLTEEVAKKAKKQNINQFIYMSSMIVFGISSKIGKSKFIDKYTIPKPQNAYGDSKLQAEHKLIKLTDDSFKVVILRPPMIYGKNSKGNYPILSKYAKKLPIFPNIKNERSMLYIENLCEFIRLMIANHEQGIFHPQNNDYVCTSNLVKIIANKSGNKIILTKIFNPIIYIFAAFLPVINKVFGNLNYSKELSLYNDNYNQVSFIDSIERSK